ncbi:ABC transporter ATP-binding protein [Paenibacillus wulumuqiensis]|uniref:ABC transporter ATP-binding protein n=1 Tax=Paenibacillus wulumuqiensis TaxID=1567107 RepID=UPI00061962E2|nr:ABC transporter ATP-binding protein [Paenibacillus wulumuqiensis]
MLNEVNLQAVQPELSHPNRGIWKTFFHLCIKARLPILWILGYMLVAMIAARLGLMVPDLTGQIFGGNVTVQIVSLVIIYDLVSSAAGQINGLGLDIINARIDRNFRNVLWDKILKLPPCFFDKLPAQSLISRITIDTQLLRSFISQVVIGELLGIYTFYITLRQVSQYNQSLSYLLLGVIPVMLILAFVFGRLYMRVAVRVQDKTSNLAMFLSELIVALPTIKAFNKEKVEAERGEQAIQSLYEAKKKALYVSIFDSVFSNIQSLVQNLVLILIGIYLLNSGQLTVAGWYAFYIFANTLLESIQSRSGQWTLIKTTQGSLLRVANIMENPEEGARSYAKDKVESGNIHFDQVSFGYEPDSPVLNNVTLQIPKHKLTFIIGPSGKGKSTILKLLERLYEPDQGRILLNGTNIQEYDIQNWRREIGYVFQDVPLMTGTIRENMLFGLQGSYTNEEIAHAAELANAHRMVMDMPEGYDTEVGQFGCRLSGGQRQRIGIARAILQNPKYLILDEPTSSLDAKAAAEVIQGLKSLKTERTVIVITHDKQAIQHADYLIVFNEDGTLSSGTPFTLSMSNSFYRQMMNEEEQ